MNAVKLNNVNFSYVLNEKEVVKAVNNISLEIEEGSFVCIVGHNGSGKSTLAKLFNGLLLPDSGDVEIFGVNTKDKTKIYDIGSSVGMVFQNPDNQMVASVIEDDIAFGPENLGVEREEIIKRVDWALDKVGMLEHKKGTPFKLSGGQKQRLAIAGVLAIKPKILVLDESTAMLDPRGRQEVMKVVYELNKKENITVVAITHYMEEAMQADRVIVMDNGNIAYDGVPSEIFKKEKELVDIKLSVPLLTQISNSIKEMGIDIDAENVTNIEELCDRLCQLL